MKNKKLRSILGLDNDIVLRIYSILLAILIWFIMSVTLYPTIEKTIDNVPVEITIEGTNAEAYHLEPINFKNKTVDVKVSGKRYDIGDLKADDLIATLDIIGIDSSGDYELKVNVKPKNGKNINIKSITPNKMKVTFDNIIEKTFDLTAEASGITAPNDYLIDAPVSHPKTITIKGPSLQMDRIDKVLLRTTEKGEFTKSQNFDKPEIAIYAGNTRLSNSLFTFNTQNFTIELPIYKIKTVPLKVETHNAPPDFDLSSLKFNYSQSDIQIAGTDAVLENINDINLGYIDMRNLSLNSSFDFDMPEIANVKNISAVDKVSLTLDASDLDTKKVALKKSQIHVLGVPSEFNTSVSENGIYNISIIGPKKIISQINSEDLVAQVDLTGESISANTYSKPVTIYSPKYNTVWALGTKNITIKVTSK